jgi:hypothetical protein
LRFAITPRGAAHAAGKLGSGVLIVLAAFFSFAGSASALPASRGWELVSPYENPLVTGVSALPYGRPGIDGHRMAFQVMGDLNSGSNAFRNTYLATRTDERWTTEKISPQASQPPNNESPRDYPFSIFNADLSEALFASRSLTGQPLVPGEPPNRTNVYRRDNLTGEVTLLTTMNPPNPVRPDISGASTDLQKVAFDTRVEDQSGPFAIGLPEVATFFSSPASGMEMVSVLPNNAFADTGVAGTVPTVLTSQDIGSFGADDRYGGSYRSVSRDGSRVFWTGNNVIGTQQLFQRRDPGTPGANTVRLSVDQAGAPADPTKPVVYWTSSTNGHKALFTSCEALTADSTANTNQRPAQGSPGDPNYDLGDTGTGSAGIGACTVDGFGRGEPFQAGSPPIANPNPNEVGKFAHNDLYMYDEAANGGLGGLIDLTTQSPDDPLDRLHTGAQVLGVLGASDDLNRIYFVAAGDLDGGGPGTVGQPNIYLLDSSTGITFVAQASRGRFNENSGTDNAEDASVHSRSRDINLWEEPLGVKAKEVRVSPDGRSIAFATRSPIDSNFDNGDVDSGLLKQIYFWKLGMSEPICASCVGDSAESNSSLQSRGFQDFPLPEENGQANYDDWWPQNMTPDGGKIFFESGDQLTADDDDASNDVFEYDTHFHTLSLIGPGNFIGATPSGGDVFIRSTKALVPWDTDGNQDVYDARVGGGQPAPPLPPEPCPGSCGPAGTEHGGPGNGPIVDLNSLPANGGGGTTTKKCKKKKKKKGRSSAVAAKKKCKKKKKKK